MLRMKLMPQVCTGTSGDRTVTTGMAISAVHPSLVRRAAASHTPFQSLLMFDADPRVLPPPSSKICCSSFAPSGFVTNM